MAQSLFSKSQKVAMFLMSLGAARSAEVLSQLDPDQVARIARDMTTMGSVSNQTKRAVVREFRGLVTADQQRAEGISFAEEVLDKALGAERAQHIMRTIAPDTGTDGPPYLTTVTPSRAAELIGNEPLHIMALLLLTLPPETSAAIVLQLPPALHPKIAVQMAHATRPAPELARHLEQALRAKALKQIREEQACGSAALNVLADAQPPAIAPAPSAPAWDFEDESEPAQAEFTFFQLPELDLPDMQTLVRRAGMHDLGLALRGAGAGLRNHCLRALPFSQRMTVQNALRSQQPVALQEITAAQARIAALARTIATERVQRLHRGELVHA